MFKDSPLIKWWNQYKQSKVGLVGLAVFVLMILAVILAPVIATHDPTVRSPDIYVGPSWSHLLGTNSQGQDVFSELLYAGRVSIMIGMVAASCIVIIGTIVGLLAGYFGGLVDEVLTRICDILLVIPRIPLMVIMAAYMGPGVGNIIFVLVVLGWTQTARHIRAQTLSAKQMGFIEAAKSTGAKSPHIMMHHILPYIAGIIIADFVLAITTSIMMESGLSFLGLGDPLSRSWGMMLFFAQQEGAFSLGAWWYWLSPGLAIALISCACSYIGNTLNDRFVLKLGRIKSKPRDVTNELTRGKGFKNRLFHRSW